MVCCINISAFFQLLGVVRKIHVDELGVVVDLFERRGGLLDVAIAELFAGELGHAVDELRVEEALLFGGLALAARSSSCAMNSGAGIESSIAAPRGAARQGCREVVGSMREERAGEGGCGCGFGRDAWGTSIASVLTSWFTYFMCSSAM